MGGMMKRSVFWLCAGLAVLFAGCPRNIAPPSDQVTDAGELIAAVEAATTSVQDVRMLDVRLDFFGQQGRASVKQLVLIQHPDRLRIQTYIPGMEGIAGVLVCACGRFAFHDRQEDVYYYGPATAENVARVLPVGLGCQDLAHVLLGGAPHQRLLALGGEPTLKWDRRQGLYRLTWEQAGPQGERAEVQVRHGDWRVTRMRTWKGDGSLEYDYTAERFESQQGLMLPGKRRFVVPGTQEDFSLAQGETQINPGLDEVLFELSPPGGSPVRYIGPMSPPPPPPVDGLLCDE